MTERPAFERSLLIPILFGVFSIFGICLVLILGQIAALRTNAPEDITATPFQYLFLGTEPAVVSATPEENGGEEESEEAAPTVTELSFADDEGPEPTETESALVILTTPTSTPASTAPLNPGTYDDTESRIVYEGHWNAQTGVTGAFQNSLHVSSLLGNSLSLRFIGQQIRFFYQPGSGLGTIQINLDGAEFELSQSGDGAGTAEWSSPLLINGTHTFGITHLSGGAINIDQIIVPDVLLTPTPTLTPTTTSTP
jgi:hypothetical protein